MKAFLEVTGVAATLFVVPLAYYYGRDHILNAQNAVYYKIFGVREKDL